MDPSKSLSKYGKRGTILGWYEIQSAFYRALPPDTVVFDSRFEPAATALVTSNGSVKVSVWSPPRYCGSDLWMFEDVHLQEDV